MIHTENWWTHIREHWDETCTIRVSAGEKKMREKERVGERKDKNKRNDTSSDDEMNWQGEKEMGDR